MDRRTDCHGRTPARLPASDAEPDAAPSILRRGSILVQQSPVGYFCIGFGEAARTLRFVFDDGPAARRAFGDPAHLAAALDREDIAAAPVIGPAAALAKHGDRHLSRLAALGELAKSGGYDPDEPRDDHGRWTSEGGGTSDGASTARLFREISAFLAATAHDDAATESIPDRYAIGREGSGNLNADVRSDPQSGVELAWTSSGPGASADTGTMNDGRSGVGAQTVSVNTIKGGPGSYIWAVQFQLSQPSQLGGWFVQQTTYSDGGGPTKTFWEAFGPVAPGQTVTEGTQYNPEYNTDDVFNTFGSLTVTASVRF